MYMRIEPSNVQPRLVSLIVRSRIVSESAAVIFLLGIAAFAFIVSIVLFQMATTTYISPPETTLLEIAPRSNSMFEGGDIINQSE